MKTVLDVGTGSGILAIWSAQAGARKVYAVEATKMADHARALVKANNLDHIVEVIEGSVEDISLPEKGIIHFPFIFSRSLQWENISVSCLFASRKSKEIVKSFVKWTNCSLIFRSLKYDIVIVLGIQNYWFLT